MAFDRETAWAGGGSWQPDDPPPAPSEPEPAPPPKAPPAATPLPTMKPAGTRAGAGLVCGRFAPLHRGHQMLIQFARESVEALTVLVFAPRGEAIPGAVRVAWIRALFPDVKVAHVEDYPDPNAPDFAARFVAACSAWQPAGPRSLFTSDNSGRVAAEALGAKLVYVDPGRVIVPISATKLRADLLGNFDFLAAPARPAFVRRVAVLGAESTGKSTLCRALAERYETAWVPEQARLVAAEHGGELTPDLLLHASQAQVAQEAALASEANRVLFCDTNALQATLWHERLFGASTPTWLTEHATSDTYDLILLCAPDVPFVGAAERDRPTERAAFHEALARRLAKHPALISIVGSWDQRLGKARAAIDNLRAAGGFLAARAPSLFQTIGASGKL